MTVKDLDELHKLLKICRKQGVGAITVGDISITFGDLPALQAKRSSASDDKDEIETDEPTPEQMAFYSALPPGGFEP